MKKPPKGYVAPETLVETGAQIRPLKEQTYALMNIKPGDRVLDVGCGPGVDLPALSTLVGPTGEVVGVENDPSMYPILYKVAQNVQNTVHVEADAHELPFESGHFDSCRADRVLQHVKNPAKVVAEMYRVTKPTGKVVVLGADVESFSVSGSGDGLERVLSDFVRLRGCESPHAMKTLPETFYEVGFKNVKWKTISHEGNGSYGPESFLYHIEDELVDIGVWSQNELARWREYRHRATQGNYFYLSMNFVMLSGQKPIRATGYRS